MPQRCSVPKCPNSYKNRSSLVRFPKDLNLKAKWILAIGRKEWTPRPSDRICEVHFDVTDWLDYTKKKLLKPYAIPKLACKSLNNATRQENVLKKSNVNRKECMQVYYDCLKPSFKARKKYGHSGLDSEKQNVAPLYEALKAEHESLTKSQARLRAEIASLDEVLFLHDLELIGLSFDALKDAIV